MLNLGFIDRRFLIYLGLFIAGILCARYAFLEFIRPWHVIVCIGLFLVSILFYVCKIFPIISGSLSKPGIFSPIGISAFFLTNIIMITFVIILYKAAGKLNCSGNFRLIEIISYASYCMFLFHRPIWWGMARVWTPSYHYIQMAYMIILGIPLIILWSYYIQKAYDKYPAQYLKYLLK
jgi:hypothetical protein